MPQPLALTLGELPSGVTRTLSDNEVGEHLRKQYIFSDVEKSRMAKMARRIDMFHDRTAKMLRDIVDGVFTNATVKAKLKKFIPYARHQNVTRRIVEELSTVYSEAANRSVAEGQNEQYQALLRKPSVRMDSMMRIGNEYTNLVNEVLVWYRIRRDLEPELRIIPQSMFWAVSHPLDPTRLAAIIFPIQRKGFSRVAEEPHYEVWSDWEMFHLNKDAFILSESRVEHGLGRIPGVLVHRRPVVDDLLDADSGDDLTSAHETIALTNLLMTKEIKSGLRIPYVAGDISNTATGQPMDTEELTIFEDGAAPGTLDLGQGPQNYISKIREDLKQIANNYGMPESVYDLSYQATSGFEITLKRQALREKRHSQIMDPWSFAERELAQLMSVMNDMHLPEFRFQVDEWNIDFGDTELPQDPMSELQYLQELARMDIISVVDVMTHFNPEMKGDPNRAMDKIRMNILLKQERLEQMRVLGTPMSQIPQNAAQDDDEERPVVQ